MHSSVCRIHLDIQRPNSRTLSFNTVIDRSHPWDPETSTDRARHWRAVWQYRAKRARLDLVTLEKQRDKALRIVESNQAVKSARFVTTTGTTKTFNQVMLDRATRIAG